LFVALILIVIFNLF